MMSLSLWWKLELIGEKHPVSIQGRDSRAWALTWWRMAPCSFRMGSLVKQLWFELNGAYLVSLAPPEWCFASKIQNEDASYMRKVGMWIITEKSGFWGSWCPQCTRISSWICFLLHHEVWIVEAHSCARNCEGTYYNYFKYVSPCILIMLFAFDDQWFVLS